MPLLFSDTAANMLGMVDILKSSGVIQAGFHCFAHTIHLWYVSDIDWHIF